MVTANAGSGDPAYITKFISVSRWLMHPKKVDWSLLTSSPTFDFVLQEIFGITLLAAMAAMRFIMRYKGRNFLDQ